MTLFEEIKNSVQMEIRVDSKDYSGSRRSPAGT